MLAIMIYLGGATFEYRYQRDAMCQGRFGSFVDAAFWPYELGYLICAMVRNYRVVINKPSHTKET